MAFFLVKEKRLLQDGPPAVQVKTLRKRCPRIRQQNLSTPFRNCSNSESLAHNHHLVFTFKHLLNWDEMVRNARLPPPTQNTRQIIDLLLMSVPTGLGSSLLKNVGSRSWQASEIAALSLLCKCRRKVLVLRSTSAPKTHYQVCPLS